MQKNRPKGRLIGERVGLYVISLALTSTQHYFRQTLQIYLA